jgi:hypothetical protein
MRMPGNSLCCHETLLLRLLLIATFFNSTGRNMVAVFDVSAKAWLDAQVTGIAVPPRSSHKVFLHAQREWKATASIAAYHHDTRHTCHSTYGVHFW